MFVFVIPMLLLVALLPTDLTGFRSSSADNIKKLDKLRRKFTEVICMLVEC